MSFRAFALAAMSAAILVGCSDDAVVAPSTAESFAVTPGETPEAVYTMTNAVGANEVVVHAFGPSGVPGEIARVATGGQGSGQRLASDGSVVLTPDGRWLLVANAGSDDVSLFRVQPSGLTLEDVVPSGGTMPVSIAVHGDLVYVLNAGVPNMVTGYQLDAAGRLTPLRSATGYLSGPDTWPTDIEFTPDGKTLVVMERGTAQITTLPVRGSGLLGRTTAQPTGHPRPLGSAFAPDGLLFATVEADVSPAGDLVAYAIDRRGTATPVGPAGPDFTLPPLCWIEIATPTFVFASSPSAGGVFSYRYGGAGGFSDGTLATMTGTGSKPTHLIARAGILSVLTPGAGSIQYFEITSDGTLSPTAVVGGLPASASGLAGR